MYWIDFQEIAWQCTNIARQVFVKWHKTEYISTYCIYMVNIIDFNDQPNSFVNTLMAVKILSGDANPLNSKTIEWPNPIRTKRFDEPFTVLHLRSIKFIQFNRVQYFISMVNYYTNCIYNFVFLRRFCCFFRFTRSLANEWIRRSYYVSSRRTKQTKKKKKK